MGPEVRIFILSVNCQADFDSDFWSGFDAAISEEWNVAVVTSCYEIKEFPSKLYEYRHLANTMLIERDANFTTVAGPVDNFARYFDALLLGQSSTHHDDEQVVFLTEYSEKVFQKPLARDIAFPLKTWHL